MQGYLIVTPVNPADAESFVTEQHIDDFQVFLGKVARGVQALLPGRTVLFSWKFVFAGGELGANIKVHVMDRRISGPDAFVDIDGREWESLGFITGYTAWDPTDGSHLKRTIEDLAPRLRAATL